MSAEIAVVHLVRQSNGPDPVDAFLSSYERHDAGCEHDLVLLLKGYPNAEEVAQVRRRARYLATHELEVPDDGFDLTAYFSAASALPHRRLCFVNSFSVVAARGWLGFLSAALDVPGTGIAGATGSWESHRSFALALLRIPNGYRGTLGDRDRVEPSGSIESLTQRERLAHLAKTAIKVTPWIVCYPGFPAPHVRTNAFVIERELLLSLRRGALRTKSAAQRFESGTRGLTAQLHGRGLTARVVGRDGVTWAPEAWPEADLFWQGKQRDLLVTDNQTRAYEHASAGVRGALSRAAWGPWARPG